MQQNLLTCQEYGGPLVEKGLDCCPDPKRRKNVESVAILHYIARRERSVVLEARLFRRSRLHFLLQISDTCSVYIASVGVIFDQMVFNRSS